MFLCDSAHCAANAFRLAAIKSCGFNLILELGLRRVRVVFRGSIFLEQGWRNHVDAFVCALRRENRRHQKLERIAKIEFAMRVGINFRPRFHQLGNAFPNSHPRIM